MKLRSSAPCLCALALSLPLGAEAATQAFQFVTGGASANAFVYGDGGALYLSVSQTTTKRPDGGSQAFLSFNTVAGVWPYDFVQIGGSGYVPASGVSSNAVRISIGMADLASVPGFYLSGYRCAQGICEFFVPSGPLPVDLAIRATKNYTVDMTGGRRLRAELIFPVGSTYSETQNGSSSYSSASIEGNLAGTALPLSNPVSSDVSMSSSRGVIVSVTRTSP